MAPHLYEALQLMLIVVTINQTYCWSTGRDLVFDKFGEYGEGFHLDLSNEMKIDKVLNEILFVIGFKQYFIPKNVKAQWHECKRLCEEFGMEFARFELQAEAEYIIATMLTYGGPGYFILVDGIATTPGVKTGWYWTKSRYPIDYLSAQTWTAGQPNNFQGDQFCLALEKATAAAAGSVATVTWNDVPCYANANAISVAVGPRPFLCQIKHENFIHRVINNQGK